MSKFKKGQSGNPAGKKPGTRNITTRQSKEVLTGILKRNFTPAKVNQDLKAMEPKQRLDVFIRLLTFILPRPTEGSLNIGFENLSDEQLTQIIHEILNSKNDETN